MFGRWKAKDRSFVYRAVWLWNELPQTLTAVNTLKFKAAFKSRAWERFLDFYLFIHLFIYIAFTSVTLTAIGVIADRNGLQEILLPINPNYNKLNDNHDYKLNLDIGNWFWPSLEKIRLSLSPSRLYWGRPISPATRQISSCAVYPITSMNFKFHHVRVHVSETRDANVRSQMNPLGQVIFSLAFISPWSDIMEKNHGNERADYTDLH